MNTNWTIDKATANDASAIAHFQVDMAAESEDALLNYETVFRGVSEGLKDQNKCLYLVAHNEDGLAIASLMLTREWSDWNCAWYWWIQSVYVSPDYRRKGVYRSMYNKVKDMAKKANVNCVRLYVDRTNTKGLSTYKSVGMAESHYLLYEELI